MGERSFRASAAGVEKLSLAFKKYPKTQDCLAGVVGCTRQIVSKFLNGKPVDKQLFTSLCNELKLDWLDIAELESEQDKNSRTVSSMNSASVISNSITEGTGAVAVAEEPNKVQTCITYKVINGQYIITIPGDINSFLQNPEEQNFWLECVKRGSGDKNATISKIERGSIKITFNVSPEGIKKLEAEPDKIILIARIISRVKGEELDLSDTDLSGVDLSGVDLSGIDFSCADLSNSNLQDANLENADLDCADLRGANLRGANLRDTSLNDAIIDDKWLTVWKIVNQSSVVQNLRRGDLSNALKRAEIIFVAFNRALIRTEIIVSDLSNALERASFIVSDLTHALKHIELLISDLSNTDLSNTDLSSVLKHGELLISDLSNADLSSVLKYSELLISDLSSGDLSSALNSSNLLRSSLERTCSVFTNLERVLSSAELERDKLERANISGADLSGADLSGADLTGADLTGADLRDANLSGAKLQRTNLSGADLSGADLSGADLRDANLREANLREAKVENARFGYNPGIDEDV